MTENQIQLAFLDWWKDSFPLMPPNSRTIETHVAFSTYLLELQKLVQDE
jgi:hypothetical protein